MNLLLGQYQSLAGKLDCSLDKLRDHWGVSIGAGDSQSVLSSVKLQTKREETRLLKKRQKKLKALGVDHVVDPPTGHSFMCKKPRNRRFVRRQRREETSKTANDTPVVNLSSVDLTESENRLSSKGLGFCHRPKSYDRGNLLHDTKVFSRRMRLKSHYIDRDDTNRSSEKYPNFVPKSDWQPPKKGPDLETFINSVESDIPSQKPSKPKHDNLTKSEEIFIKPADKGSAVVVMDRDHYI